MVKYWKDFTSEQKQLAEETERKLAEVRARAIPVVRSNTGEHTVETERICPPANLNTSEDADPSETDIAEAFNVSTSSGKKGHNLTSLPMELQLRVLRACVVADTPIIDMRVHRALSGYASRVEKEHRGQEDIHFRILATCRVYHEEGWKMFWQQNTFTFLRFWEAGSYRSSGFPSIPEAFERLPRYTMLRHLSLRYGGEDLAGEGIMTIMNTVYLVQDLPAIETLNLDNAVSIDTWNAYSRSPAYCPMKYATRHLDAIRDDLDEGDLMHDGHLRQITFTGMYLDEEILLLIALSHLWKPGGRLGRLIDPFQEGEAVWGVRYVASAYSSDYVVEQKLEMFWFTIPELYAKSKQRNMIDLDDPECREYSRELQDMFNLVYEARLKPVTATEEVLLRSSGASTYLETPDARPLPRDVGLRFLTSNIRHI